MTVVAEGVEREDQAARASLARLRARAGLLVRPPHRRPSDLELDGFNARVRPGLGDPFVIREFMRQIGIPARIQ